MKMVFRSFMLLGALSLALACSDDDTNNNQTKQDGGGSSQKDGGGSTKMTGPICMRTCTKVDDCCKKPPCDKGMSSYECTKGFCKFLGCKTDADCMVSGVKVGTCQQGGQMGYKFGTCGLWCDKDSECTAPLKCVMEVKTFSKKMCGVGCKKDVDCKSPTLKCVDGKYCGPKTTSPDKCTKDTQCNSLVGLTKCETKTGQCICEGDQKCQDALKAGGGTYKCTKLPY